MDQGFSSQGFTAPPKVSVRARASAPLKKTTQLANADRKAEGAINRARGFFSSLGLMDMAAMFLPMPVMWVAKKTGLKKLQASAGLLKSVSQAAHYGPDDMATYGTQAKDAFQYPANVMKAFSAHAEEAGVRHWAESAEKKSLALAEKGVRWKEQFSNFVAPVTNFMSRGAERVAQSGLAKATPNVVKSALVGVRSMSLFGALMTASAALGITAAVFASRASSKESKAALKGLAADLGGENGAFFKAMKASKGSEKTPRAAKLGVEVVSSVADAVMWAAPAMNPLKAMGAMAVTQLCGSLIPDNTKLGAYVVLEKADAGELKLESAARMELIKQLIAVMPSVSKHGGVYNRLAGAMAHEMAARNMTAKDIAHTLDNEGAFTKLSAEVQTKMDAAKAAVHAPAANETRPAAANDPHMSKVEKAYHVADKPTMAAVHSAQHGGKLAHVQQSRQA